MRGIEALLANEKVSMADSPSVQLPAGSLS